MVCLCDCVAVFVKGPSFLAECSEHSSIHFSLDITILCLGGDCVEPFSLFFGYREAWKQPPVGMYSLFYACSVCGKALRRAPFMGRF